MNMENQLIYDKNHQEEFLKEVEELIHQDQYTPCIQVIETIPQEERDYQLSYLHARLLQNFAIIGDDEKQPEYLVGEKALLKSLEILKSIQEEGQDKAEWNMRMAYAYQYLPWQEEKAIPYAQRWAELDPDDPNALLVIEECKQQIQDSKDNIAKQIEIDEKACREVKDILQKHQIKSAQELKEVKEEELDLIHSKIQLVQEKYDLDQDYMQDILEELLGEFGNDEQEDWDVYTCKWYDGKPAMVLVNLSYADFESTSLYPKRIKFTIHLQDPDEKGLPSQEEKETLYVIEDFMESFFEERQVKEVGILRTNKQESFFAYAEESDDLIDELAVVFRLRFEEYPYEIEVVDDENWDAYFQALYPNPYVLQSMKNQNILIELQINGDTMEERMIEHSFFFENEEDREAFFHEIQKDGFDLGHEEYGLSNRYPYQLVIQRNDSLNKIDEVTWHLMNLVEGFSGYYDGWGCPFKKEVKRS